MLKDGELVTGPDKGYEYFEFVESEYLKPHTMNVVLMSEVYRKSFYILFCTQIYILQDKSLYSGAGAKFFCIGRYKFNYISKNKVPPPSLENTQWTHIFIQSHSDRRNLLSDTKFLYLEYNTPKVKDND